MASSARALAAEVLARVWEGGAYAAPALDAELGRSTLDERDRRLATELVYGVLRAQGYLEARIARHAANDRWRKKAQVRAHLLIAAYALACLDRVPAHAAVSEAVAAIKGSADHKVAGFANAVLRKLAREEERVGVEEAAAASLPRWLRARLDAAVGAEGARALVSAAVPPLCLCLRAGEDRQTWLETLRAAAPGASIEPGAISPRAIRIAGAGDPRKLPGADSAFTVQEEGAQVVALALGARAGETILDACAGRGGKAILLAEEGAAVDAADLHLDKLAELRARPGGARVREIYGVDWTRGSGGIRGLYRGVLVDAPCSGSGTLRRRPEIAARLGASDLTRLASLQLTIARAAARHLEDGGRLIYAVCSILTEECEGVVEALTRADAELTLEPAPFDAPLPILQGKTSLRLLPHEHGTDGYFIASFRAHRISH